MATLIRSAKSGNQWTSHELKAFNIQVLQQDASSFFSLQELPAPSDISPAIWNNVAAPPAVELSRNERRFFTFLRDAADPEEPFIIDFAVFLLREILKYDDDDDGHRTLHTQRDSEMPFHMCGSKVYTNADVVMHGRLSDGFQYTLLVQEDKHRKPFDDPEAQLVAKAIAAFHHNTRARRMNQLPALESQTFPAITMADTAAVFYKITSRRTFYWRCRVENTRQTPLLFTGSSRLLIPSTRRAISRRVWFLWRAGGFFSNALKHSSDFCDT